MNWDPKIRLRAVISAIAIGMAASMAISWTLWAGDRAFPKFPAIPAIPDFGPATSTFATLAFFALLAVSALRPTRTLIALALACMLVFALQDQMRWQPWFYQYALMLFPLVFRSKEATARDHQAILGLMQLTLVAIYLWSGLHKCHAGFLSVHEGLVEPLIDEADPGLLGQSLQMFGFAIPAVEILTGLGLLFRRTRPVALVAALLTHLSILILIGPVQGRITNPVVWPWNLAMAAFAVILFHKADTIDISSFRLARLRYASYLLGVLLFVAPALFYAGKWDRYLAFNLYGGWQKRLLVKIEQRELALLPPSWADRCVETKSADRHLLLSPSKWATDELRVPFVSEWRIIRSFSHTLCDHGIGGENAIFYVDFRHLPNKPKRYFTCRQIHEMRPLRPENSRDDGPNPVLQTARAKRLARIPERQSLGLDIATADLTILHLFRTTASP